MCNTAMCITVQLKNAYMNFLLSKPGPVVQSIVSQRKSFVEDLLSLSVLTKSITVIFFAEKL